MIDVDVVADSEFLLTDCIGFGQYTRRIERKRLVNLLMKLRYCLMACHFEPGLTVYLTLIASSTPSCRCGPNLSSMTPFRRLAAGSGPSAGSRCIRNGIIAYSVLGDEGDCVAASGLPSAAVLLCGDLVASSSDALRFLDLGAMGVDSERDAKSDFVGKA